MKTCRQIMLGLAIGLLALQSCKEGPEVFDDPYADGKTPLGVALSQTEPPSPAQGSAGTEVTFKATGLDKYKDQLSFLFNGEKAEVVQITETSIRVKVPAVASSGVTSIAIGDQLVIGPEFRVTGFINLDPSFRVPAGTNGFVSQVYELPDGRNIVVGGFTNYDNKGISNILPINRIARTSRDGEYDRTFRTGKGANGQLSRIIEIGGRYIIAGGFSGYNQRTENISNLTSLFVNGSIDTVKIQTARRPTSTDTVTQKWFPRFNGGTTGFINRLYSHQGKILATGNFTHYVKRIYDKPNYDFTRDTVIVDSTEIRQIIRFNLDGSLDKTYRFNAGTNKGGVSANGPIDTYMHTDERLVVFGSFTTFDGQPANRIIRLTPAGTPDPTFNPGKGPNEGISSLTYNATTRKYILTGGFSQFNDRPSPGLVMLNEDGSVDPGFVPKAFFGGYPGFARQLRNGLIVVAGSFQKYDNVTRSGFMILNPDGTLAAGYNATGPFNGFIEDIVETTSADGKPALLIMGGFSRFDNQNTFNLTRVTIQ
ncbi:hypothetical protein C7T94_14775 [Pedobacter yulinensis]|uniref:DUF5008 domain-containing protein n=1 Tax=Pedobacter yulinensis TaxID=2126353 RepID=A0A2T3HI07_9SPHI|nr:DUF5008 domain-containing protein [Pedobacter yulinensis]PST82069.1 hypothetical protein C7T94_14775 [Pedobacter yulinensis]